MSLWAVKNDKGEYFDYDNNCWEAPADGNYVIGKDTVSLSAELHGGHPVELVEKPEPVEVSEDAADLFKGMKREIEHSDSGAYVYEYFNKLLKMGFSNGDIYKALANHWHVKQPTRYNVKVPHTDNSFYWKSDYGTLEVGAHVFNEKACFTEDEIEHYGLSDCIRVEA